MYVIYIYKEWKEIMKKYKGQSLAEFVLSTVVIFGVIAGTMLVLGTNLANVFKTNNPAKTFNAKRTLQFEKPQNIVTNVTVTVGGFSIASPVETIVKANLLNGSSLSTDSSLGKLIEMAQIMQEYGAQLNALTATMPATAARSNFLTALAAYKTIIDTAVTKVTTTGVTDLEIKLALFDMTLKLNPSSGVSTALNTALTAYLGTLPASTKKTIINLFTTDLFNFAKSTSYDVNNSLYEHEISQHKNNTIAQDQTLVNQMNINFSGYTPAEKTNYTKKIKLYPDANYSTLAPSTYNDETLCTTLGGSGDPCIL